METVIDVRIAFIFDSMQSRPDELAHSINQGMQNLFNDIPLTIPVPNDPNLDNIPVVQMKSHDDIYSCNVARARADFFMKGYGIQNYSDIRDNLIHKKDLFLNFMFASYRAKRIAFIIRYFIQDEHTGSSISRLINQGFITLIPGDPLQSIINYATKTLFHDVQINNLVTLETNKSRIHGIPEELNGALITRDFNTNAEGNYVNLINKGFFDQLINYGETNMNLSEIKNLIWPTV